MDYVVCMRVEVGGCSLYFSKDASVAFPQVLLVSLFFKLITRKNIFAAPLGEMKILIDKFLRFFSISFQFKLQSGEGNAKLDPIWREINFIWSKSFSACGSPEL